MSNLAPARLASPWGAPPACESSLATLRPPVFQVKLMRTCVAEPVFTEKASKPVDTSPARFFTLDQVSPRSSSLAHFSNCALVP